ncbi:hypothetical protein LUZ61_013404 [Rhynchospora tenuis]|uniref:Uncharacterized protein n=1 Tax=Rhynchospora tenuis TaxID=198213 RepID=A0AAD5W9B5_9POAL|nr:hypothetical protein LUZ61_013404 [Rhynchospora tenuis]
MRQYAVSFSLLKAGSHKKMVTTSIDVALQLSDTYGVEKMDFGIAVVLFLVNAMTNLLDCILDDWSLLVASEAQFVKEGSQSMHVDVKGGLNNNRSKYHQQLKQPNAFTALEVVENLFSSKFVQVSLRLVYRNLSQPFEGLLQRLELIKNHNTHTSSPSINQLFEKLFCLVREAKCSHYRLTKQCLLGHLFDTGLANSPQSLLISSGKASCWIPFDVFMENVMDGKTFCPAASFEILTGLTRTLQIVNQASWCATFQALWISALRLVQRAKDPVAGPIPYIESRLSMLMSMVPLSILPLLKEENGANINVGTGSSSRKQSFVACLQSLTQFVSLLDPPQPVVSASNDAATKAAIAVVDFKKEKTNMMVPQNYSIKAVGNLLHLVVESCIARDLIDTSAYFWPGYVVPCMVPKDSNVTPIEECPWSNFMQGAPLTRSLQSVLMAIPAPSVIELKKLNHLALHGSEEERSAAPKILCGASLKNGWNIQEYVVHIAVKLLSPQISLKSPVIGDANHYLSHVHMLSSLLSCLSCHTVIHILALYGMIPEVVAALMPLCEAFGSFPPASNNHPNAGEEVSAYSVFSFAFLFLLRLCKFHGPDKDPHPYICGAPARPDLKLDFLLLMRDSRIRNNYTTSMKNYLNNVVDLFQDLRCHSVYVDMFPKLRAWYFENQAYLAPGIFGNCNSNRMHQMENKILIFVCRNMNKGKWPISGSGSSCSTITSTSSSTSSTSVGSASRSSLSMYEDEYQSPPVYPAWELLEAVPHVLEAILTACARGQISSCDLTTGLRDLVVFFPASIAAIIRYFKAEITRGRWESVPLNGIDWPSPEDSLNSFRLEVKEVLESVGVYIESWSPDDAPPMLPLPLAAFLSLTITFKLDKNSEYTRAVTGQAIANYATISPWPIMSTIGALWARKAPRWHDFLVFLGLRSCFINDKDAMTQLLQSCFKSFLDPSSWDSNYMTSTRGVVGLLGESVCNSRAMSPGFLFLHTCHVYHAPYYFSEVILKLVVEWACKLADEYPHRGCTQLKFGQPSFATAISAVRQVAMLGTSLLCMAGRSPLVRVLFEDTLPIFLLSKREERSKPISSIGNITEGYALSYLLFFSTAMMWGVQTKSALDKSGSSEMSPHVITSHLDFITRVLKGTVELRCDPAMWKAHVSSFVGLIIRFSPAWVLGAKVDVLKQLSNSLRSWQQYDLALSLLELGGTSAIEAALESLL